MSNKKLESIPLPENSKDRERWERTKLRSRILEGEWRRDLENHMSLHLPATRFAAWGPPTVSLNLFKSTVQQLSVLYDQKPSVINESLTPEQSQYLDSMELFSKSQTHNDMVIGLRESFIKLQWNPGSQVSKPGVVVDLVSPNEVVAYSLPNRPDVPVRIEHAVLRFNPKSGEQEWVWDIWDISNPEKPFFVIETSGDKRTDVTADFIPENEVGSYPYIDPDTNIPFLPWILYHAEDTGKMFNPNGWEELVSATLDVALLMSFYIHIVKDASWAQKYGLDVELNGLDTVTDGSATRQTVATDVSSILLFSSKDNKTGSLNTFTTASDSKQVIESIRDYANAAILNIGIPPQDIQRVAPQSGVAIRLKRDSIRKFQRSFAPNFRRGDIELLEKAAKISNLFSDSSTPTLPVEGYNIVYTSLPKDYDEIKQEVEVSLNLIEQGLMSKIDLLLSLDPSLGTRENAIEKMRQNKQDNNL